MSAGVPETTMPQIRGGGEECGPPCWFIANEGVEVAGTSGDHENFPSVKILHKKTEKVKFDRERVIMSKLTNINKVGEGKI